MDLHVDVIKGGMETYGIYENAIFMPGLRDPHYSEYEQKTRHEPDVVTCLPPTRRRTPTAQLTPALRRLPRP